MSEVSSSNSNTGQTGGPSRSRVPVVVTLLIALVCTGVSRQMVFDARLARVPRVEGSGQIVGMNSFALGLLLGGLRGPLVMILWTDSESRKADRNLEDVDTEIEWIRMLQPEFDSVHLYQIWNKAYNVSAQMATVSNKYRVILDALRYADDVDRQRPSNINIIQNIGAIYSDKLGGASEKLYYRGRVRRETMPREPGTAVKTSRTGSQLIELDPLLDDTFHLLPKTLTPTGPLLSDPAKSGLPYDGSALQLLKKYEPFPYGVPTTAVGYNYQKRAQLILRLTGQSHAQLSDQVIDSRPGLALKQWAEEEWEDARRCEIDALGIAFSADSSERMALELPAANVAADIVVNPGQRAMLDRAIYEYDRAAKLAPDSLAEYKDHLKKYVAQELTNYSSHMDALAATEAMCSADRDYLSSVAATTPAERKSLLTKAGSEYVAALDLNARIALLYFTPDDIAARILPPGATRENARSLPPAVVKNAADSLATMYMQGNAVMRSTLDDADEFVTYVIRCEVRLDRINEYLKSH